MIGYEVLQDGRSLNYISLMNWLQPNELEIESMVGHQSVSHLYFGNSSKGQRDGYSSCLLIGWYVRLGDYSGFFDQELFLQFVENKFFRYAVHFQLPDQF